MAAQLTRPGVTYAREASYGPGLGATSRVRHFDLVGG